MNRLITEQEEQAYRLCSPDFWGLTYENAAILLHCHLSTVFRRLKQLKKRFPQLFYNGFIRPRTPHSGNPNDYNAQGENINLVLQYHPSMDGDVVMKF